MEHFLRLAKKILPKRLFSMIQPGYHYILALLGAIIYRFPSRHIKVIAVTGTKGKSTVVELTNAILEEAGFKTAVLGTIRFKVGDQSRPNLYKMTTPGRFFVQKFLRQSVTEKCEYAVLEMTSEAARQFRHKFIEFNALIFTNLSPEHIESHGSYEKYVAAKLSIGKALEQSSKKKYGSGGKFRRKGSRKISSTKCFPKNHLFAERHAP
jgi:UDP-N-acetylmuramoyl-L-alanyl-D-glutamate--2,6-diaminopimelate ligase